MLINVRTCYLIWLGENIIQLEGGKRWCILKEKKNEKRVGKLLY